MIYNRTLVEALCNLKLSGCDSSNKFIPDQYKFATIYNRENEVYSFSKRNVQK